MQNSCESLLSTTPEILDITTLFPPVKICTHLSKLVDPSETTRFSGSLLDFDLLRKQLDSDSSSVLQCLNQMKFCEMKEILVQHTSH
ncbi:hypothetical protein QYF36_000687 [Acer negundo]|nr:hypothetical protein QYF36_000687 [Acer negundo]